MLLFLATFLLVLLVPHDALAWGAGFHLQLGSTVLQNLRLIDPIIASVISEYPNDFLYGCIAADITIGKKFTHYLQHCHRWSIGLKILQHTESRLQKACAYGYLTHLAADTIAHNYFVPFKIMRSFSTLTLKHTYWEMRFENLIDKEMWEIGKKVSMEHYKLNDELLRNWVSGTLFSFDTNKKIFNSILLLGRLEKWQKVLKTLSENSRYELEPENCNEYAALAEEAVFDFLKETERSRYLNADPTGEMALKTAHAVRKNLRLLYKSGKITREQAIEQLEEIKGKLRNAICSPELLQEILSPRRRILRLRNRNLRQPG
ncbi:MAG TPA: zinc dependent phospholipase C family protein [Geobacteraceae bacterium]|nr:zinc dependent phospholipase C family protein [Geobacteraceae bacterium]